MIIALVSVGVVAAWCFTVWIAYRIGVGIGLTRAAMFAAESLASIMDEMVTAANRRPNFEDRVDVN